MTSLNLFPLVVNGQPVDANLWFNPIAEAVSELDGIRDELDPRPFGVIKRGRRTTASTASAAEIGVMRLPLVPLTFGRAYRISTTNLQLSSTTSTDLVVAKIRIATDGSTATTASTDIGIVQGLSNGFPSGPIVTEYYPAGADEQLSVLLTCARGSGAGNARILGATTWPISLFVEDIGLDPGNEGIPL